MSSLINRPTSFEAATHDRRIRERRALTPVSRVELAPSVARVSWSGVWGGFLSAVGIWILLSTLGAAVGLSNVGAGSSLRAVTYSGATAAWLYFSALVALFFGSEFGTRMGMVIDGAAAWLEGTLVWTFALVLTTLVSISLVNFAIAHPLATQAVAGAQPTAVTTSASITAGWLTFVGIVIAWVVTLLGSLWGRAQARGRAHSLGLAA